MDLQPSEAQKRAFGIRLRDLRLDAGISSAQELANRTGFSHSKVSRAENGRTSLSEKDLRLWATVCGAEGQIPELVAAYREVEQAWSEYRRDLKVGQKVIQLRGRQVYLESKLARVYEAMNIPGILQTYDYARAQFVMHARLHSLPLEDVDEAAHNRLTAQPLVTEGGGPLFSFILEAAALHTTLGDAAVMNAQLDLLQQVATMPHVALGIIPLTAVRTLFPGECFYLLDDREVRQEFWSGALRTTRSEDIAYFVKVFTMLRRQAVYGAAAREEIEAARRRVQGRAMS